MQSTEVPANETTPPVPPPVSRREFLAGAAACAVISPTLLRAATRPSDRQTLLHVASNSGHSGYVHTYAVTSDGCTPLGATAVDACAALTRHPHLPVLYVARDCHQWKDLPRGVIETYAAEHTMPPLRLLARIPMALSATGPRSLAVSSCGRHLLVSASMGGAWNAFALNREGMPAGVAIARKETGTMLNSHTVSLPTPRGLVFSPHAPLAMGTDPGSGRMTLLQPASEELAVLARFESPYGLTSSSPVWTGDGRYVITANARNASLSVCEVRLASGNAGIHLAATTPTPTPVTILVAHPTQPAVFTSRPQGSGSRLEFWKLHGADLRLAGDTWVGDHVVALAVHAGALWVAARDRLICLSAEDLRSRHAFELPLPMRGVHAIVTQNLAARHFHSV